MKPADPESLAIHLGTIAMRFMPPDALRSANPGITQAAWSMALKRASTLHEQALDHASRRQKGDGRTGISEIIESGGLGRASELDSVVENRIIPRVPNKRELAKCRENFHPHHSDSHKKLIKRAVEAVNESKIPPKKKAAACLNLLGWPITKERVIGDKSLDWGACSHERRIIEPVHPPTVEDVTDLMHQAAEEFIAMKYPAPPRG